MEVVAASKGVVTKTYTTKEEDIKKISRGIWLIQEV